MRRSKFSSFSIPQGIVLDHLPVLVCLFIRQRGEDPFAQCKTMLAQMTKEQSDGNASAKYQNMGPETNPKAELL